MNYNIWTQFGKDLKTDDILYLQECGKMGTYTLFMGYKFVQFLDSSLKLEIKYKIPLLRIYLKCTQYKYTHTHTQIITTLETVGEKITSDLSVH